MPLCVATLAELMASEVMDEAYGHEFEGNPLFDYKIEMPDEHRALEKALREALARLSPATLAKIWHRRLENVAQ
jgi:hypothetical protein